MVWHIFKKDWKLLWPFFVAVALVQFVPSVIRLRLGLFGEDYILESLQFPATAIALFAAAFLAVAILHQDYIPGVRQDWLVRPIRRRDLLLAKLFFVFIVVQGSIVLADTFQVVASGFSLRESLAAALDHTFFLLIFTLPPLAFAAVTSSMMEAVIGAVIGFFAGIATIMLYETFIGNAHFSTTRTGERWIPISVMVAVIILGTACVLLIQFFERRTLLARWVIGVSVLLFMLSLIAFPWKDAFALQAHFAPNPGSARSVALSFDAALGRYQRPSGLSASDERNLAHLQARETPAEIFLPLHVSGLPNDSVLKADRSLLILIAPSGKVVYRGNGESLEVRAEGPGNGQQSTHLEVDIAAAKYSDLKRQPLRAEMNYSLTLFQLSSAYGVPALGADQRMPEAGRCATQLNESGTAVELRCEQAGKGPSCGTFFLENPTTGARNPVISACDPDYAPRFEWTSDDPMSHWGLNLRFRDPSGLTHFPVDGSQLLKSQVVLRLYEPVDHFSRHVVVPAITLQDWESK